MPQSCKIDLRRRGVCVIIPTYNNAGTIEDVVTRAQAFCEDVFVVLDGCTDATLSLLEALPVRPRLVVLDRNRGKGFALKTGFRAALDAGFAFAITLDADGQHYPEDIPLFLEAGRRHPDALIVGRRAGLKNADRSGGSKFANAFSNFWFCVQTLHRLSDTQTGYRLYPLRRLRGLSLLTSRYESELELLVFSAWRGVRLAEQEVRVYYPPRSERVSHFRPFRDFSRISLLNVVLCLLALVYGIPRTVLRALLKWLKTVAAGLFLLLAVLLVVNPGILCLSVGRVTEARQRKLRAFISGTMGFGVKVLECCGTHFTFSNPYGESFDKPAVIISNHQSALDILMMLSLTPDLVIVTAGWVWHSPIYGFAVKRAGYVPVTRGVSEIEDDLKAMAAKGCSIVIYPEGTRSLDCTVQRFHKGAFYLAEALGLDILPVVMYGSGRALPKHFKVLDRWPVRMEIDRRITREELSAMGDARRQASSLRQYYSERYGAIADRIEQTLG